MKFECRQENDYFVIYVSATTKTSDLAGLSVASNVMKPSINIIAYPDYGNRLKNLQGFVQNKSDGSVYVEAEGEAIYMDAFENWCKEGPSWARVIDFTAINKPISNYSDFQIK